MRALARAHARARAHTHTHTHNCNLVGFGGRPVNFRQTILKSLTVAAPPLLALVTKVVWFFALNLLNVTEPLSVYVWPRDLRLWNLRSQGSAILTCNC